MNARDLLESLNTLDESERVEAKRCREVGTSLLETVCAFANEPGLDGGWILLGAVREELAFFPAYEVDGIEQPDKVAADLASQCRSVFNAAVRIEIRLIRRAQAAVLDDLPMAFNLPEGQLQRLDIPVIPQRVIREAIVNALMHRSYRSASPMQIIRYANRLEIRNPGFSLKSPEHLGEPGSQPRNPKIAAVLHETRFAETKGSGIRVMREAMRQAGLTPPLFESNRAGDMFVARYLFHHFLGPDDIAWLARFKDRHLSDNDAKALVFVKEAGAIDNAAYRELTGADALTASQALRRLRDAGLLEQKGRSSATYYVPTAKLEPTWTAEPQQAHSGLSSNPPPLSSKLEGLSSNPADADRQRESLLADVPGPLAARLGSLGKRHLPNEVREVVWQLCALRDWRAEELGIVLARNTEYVRNNYLRPLLREGRIVQTNAAEPNDPQQAYRAAATPIRRS
jgi:ATP-dependent DNA helicase RecG